MNPLDIIKNSAAYANGYENTPTAAQAHAKQLCWEYNQTAPPMNRTNATPFFKRYSALAAP